MAGGSAAHTAKDGAGGVDWKTVFQKFDTDGSGELDKDEFVAAMKSGGYAAALNDGDLSVLFRSIDASGDGTIDADEFANFMRTTPQEVEKKKLERVRPKVVEYIVLAKATVRKDISRESEIMGHYHRGQVVAVSRNINGRLYCRPLQFSSVRQLPSGWCSERARPLTEGKPGTVLLEKLRREEMASSGRASEVAEALQAQRRLEQLDADHHLKELADQENKRRMIRERREAAAATASSDGGRRQGWSKSRRLRSAAADAGTAAATADLWREVAANELQSCTAAEASLLVAMLERTKASDGSCVGWGRLLEHDWPEVKADLNHLLRVRRALEEEAMAASGITTAAAPAGGGLGRRQRQQAGEEEVVAAAMLRWRQERAVAAAKAAADEGLIQSVLQDATENRSRAPGRAGSEPSISVADGATGSAEAGPSRGGGASLQGRSRFLSFTTQSEENESVGGCSALAQDMVQQQRRQRDARTQLLQPHPRSPGGKRHHQGLGRRKRRSQRQLLDSP
eukprot:COSAG05_NODE_26_length_29797_cov_35.911139_1_plen_512_part_00